jgi:hypothetical protein
MKFIILTIYIIVYPISKTLSYKTDLYRFPVATPLLLAATIKHSVSVKLTTLGFSYTWNHGVVFS